jgi:hypothetical protein
MGIRTLVLLSKQRLGELVLGHPQMQSYAYSSSFRWNEWPRIRLEVE